MSTITEVKVAENLTALWGIDAYEYKVSGMQTFRLSVRFA